jgi:hypothetical protein
MPAKRWRCFRWNLFCSDSRQLFCGNDRRLFYGNRRRLFCGDDRRLLCGNDKRLFYGNRRRFFYGNCRRLLCGNCKRLFCPRHGSFFARRYVGRQLGFGRHLLPRAELGLAPLEVDLEPSDVGRPCGDRVVVFVSDGFISGKLDELGRVDHFIVVVAFASRGFDRFSRSLLVGVFFFAARLRVVVSSFVYRLAHFTSLHKSRSVAIRSSVETPVRDCRLDQPILCSWQATFGVLIFTFTNKKFVPGWTWVPTLQGDDVGVAAPLFR